MPAAVRGASQPASADGDAGFLSSFLAEYDRLKLIIGAKRPISGMNEESPGE